jgi:hypothetical protein
MIYRSEKIHEDDSCPWKCGFCPLQVGERSHAEHFQQRHTLEFLLLYSSAWSKVPKVTFITSSFKVTEELEIAMIFLLTHSNKTTQNTVLLRNPVCHPLARIFSYSSSELEIWAPCASIHTLGCWPQEIVSGASFCRCIEDTRSFQESPSTIQMVREKCVVMYRYVCGNCGSPKKRGLSSRTCVEKRSFPSWELSHKSYSL